MQSIVVYCKLFTDQVENQDNFTDQISFDPPFFHGRGFKKCSLVNLSVSVDNVYT